MNWEGHTCTDIACLKMVDGNRTYETNMQNLNSTRNSDKILYILVQDLEKKIQTELEDVTLSAQKE